MSTSKLKKKTHNPPQSGHPNLCTGLSPGMSVGSSKTSQCQCCPAPSVLWNNLPCLGQAAKHSRSSALPATVFASLNPLASSDQCWNCTEQTWGLDLTNLQSFSMDFYACFPLFSHGESTMWYVLHSCPSKSIIVHGSGGTPSAERSPDNIMWSPGGHHLFVSWFPNKKNNCHKTYSYN